MNPSAAIVFSAVLLCLAPSSLAGTATDPRRPGYSIYDEGICTSDIDCKPSQTCFLQFIIGNICRDTAAVGQPCGEFGCASTAYCDSSTENSTCVPKEGVGAACIISADQCGEGLICKKGRCLARPNLPNGTPCGDDTLDNECRGFCNRDFSPPLNGPVCAPVVPQGGPCTSSDQCAQPARPGSGRAVCNTAPFETGICVPASKLVKKLGARCDTALDTCDATRNLVCRWVPELRGAACLQKSIEERAPCELSNPRSRCAAGLVCRTVQTVAGRKDFFGDSGPLPTLCLPAVRRRAAGQRCAQEPDQCTGRATCRGVPGVLRGGRVSGLGAGPTSLALYCTRTLRRGARCSPNEKFIALCEAGFTCRGGKCRASRPGDDAKPVTHAYEGVVCENLPCAPGLKCVRPEGASGNIGSGNFSPKFCRDI